MDYRVWAVAASLLLFAGTGGGSFSKGPVAREHPDGPLIVRLPESSVAEDAGGRKPAQQNVSWRDPSAHTVQFVSVEEDVKLEVLDWGGSGRPVVLLAGLGNTAHVFDDFAPKLTAEYHVYGITRRGFGASSAPVTSYSADRLGDDVIAVLDALKLDRPILVGRSIAGQELSSVGSRHPERIAGLIYLEAGYGYAYYDRSKGDFVVDLQELQKKLDQLRSAKDLSDEKPLIEQLLQTALPGFERDLQRLQKEVSQRQPPDPEPTEEDRKSFEAWRAWEKRVYGFLIPEAELHETLESTLEGQVGTEKANKANAVFLGRQKYTDIRCPVLAIFAVPEDLGPFVDNDPIARAAFDADNVALIEPWVKVFEAGIPSAHVVRLAHANHYIFMSNEGDVLREMRAFIAGLR
jgi:non-heme chloroperoxidase